MAYIIINGRSSDEVRGLLIQELPPITLPKMRTQIATVDGRAGDIVTPLGYEAYDKKVKIGLYGAYDVDQVIAFFAQSGTVTFSNELTKYYRFQMIAQVDFNRLLRFRTADVTLHVQPYKFSTTEAARTIEDNVGHSATVYNLGNTGSRPTLTVAGSGNIGISINGVQVLQIALGTEDSITINADEMNAYNGGTLKNRLVTGDYSKVSFLPGANTLSWTGTVASVTVSNASRWI